MLLPGVERMLPTPGYNIKKFLCKKANSLLHSQLLCANISKVG